MWTSTESYTPNNLRYIRNRWIGSLDKDELQTAFSFVAKVVYLCMAPIQRFFSLSPYNTYRNPAFEKEFWHG